MSNEVDSGSEETKPGEFTRNSTETQKAQLCAMRRRTVLTELPSLDLTSLQHLCHQVY